MLVNCAEHSLQAFPGIVVEHGANALFIRRATTHPGPGVCGALRSLSATHGHFVKHEALHLYEGLHLIILNLGQVELRLQFDVKPGDGARLLATCSAAREQVVWDPSLVSKRLCRVEAATSVPACSVQFDTRAHERPGYRTCPSERLVFPRLLPRCPWEPLLWCPYRARCTIGTQW